MEPVRRVGSPSATPFGILDMGWIVILTVFVCWTILEIQVLTWVTKLLETWVVEFRWSFERGYGHYRDTGSCYPGDIFFVQFSFVCAALLCGCVVFAVRRVIQRLRELGF